MAASKLVSFFSGQEWSSIVWAWGWNYVLKQLKGIGVFFPANNLTLSTTPSFLPYVSTTLSFFPYISNNCLNLSQVCPAGALWLDSFDCRRPLQSALEQPSNQHAIHFHSLPQKAHSVGFPRASARVLCCSELESGVGFRSVDLSLVDLKWFMKVIAMNHWSYMLKQPSLKTHCLFDPNLCNLKSWTHVGLVTHVPGCYK